MTSAVIETSALGKQYGRRWALHDCTLAIPEGKVVGLVGPNGAGKTTLFHLAVGCSRRPRARSLFSAVVPPPPAELGRSASSRRTRPSTPECRSRTPAAWAAGSIRAGTASLPEHASAISVSIPGRVRDRSPVVSGPNSRSPLRSRSGRAARPRRAGCQPGSARPAGVPPDPDGSRRRAGRQRRALVTPRRRSGAGLRLPRSCSSPLTSRSPAR